MKKNKMMWFATFAVVAALALLEANEVEALTCNVAELSPCLPAFTSTNPPTSQCCDKLKEQEPCLCQYSKDPTLGKYINSPEAKKVQNICQVSVHC